MKVYRIVALVLLFAVSNTAISQGVISEMTLVPACEFTMGNDMKNGLGFSPAHKVKLDSFYIDKYEVTNKQYLEFCEATGHILPEFWNTDIIRSGHKYLNYPVVGVNYNDAKKYAEWAGKRLPTEAEWECAARGGLEGKNFPNGDICATQKLKQDSTGWKNLIEPVGSNEPNAFDIYDLDGNVWEWVADRYSETYYSESEYINPKGPEVGANRVIRGGSWHSGGMCKKVFYRKGHISGWCDFSVGFRCAKSVD